MFYEVLQNGLLSVRYVMCTYVLSRKKVKKLNEWDKEEKFDADDFFANCHIHFGLYTIYVDASDLTVALGLSWFSDWCPDLPVEDPIISWRLFVSRFMYKLPFCKQYLYFIYFYLFPLSYISMCLEANMLEIMVIEVSIEDHQVRPWLPFSVIVLKTSKSLWITPDSRNLNKALISNEFLIPHHEYLRVKLPGPNYFRN